VRAYIESVRRTGAFTAPVQFTVGTAGVSISIVAPAEGQRFAAPAAIPLSATVVDPSASVSQVTFYQLGTQIAVVQKPPYAATWADVPAGTYTINAVAQLKSGGLVSAAPVTVTVARNTPPQVALTAPGANQAFAVGQPVSMPATATDADGTIARVDFLAGTTLIGTATAPPYGVTWTPTAPGT
jgi:hypothetical protein